MTFAEFHNGLRILTSIDQYEVEAFMPGDDAWRSFCRDPFRYFIRADDETADAIWRIIEARQSKRTAA